MLTPKASEASKATVSIGGLAAVMMLAGAGTLSTGLAPLLVSGLVTFSALDVTQAGTCIGAEMAGMGFGGALVLALGSCVRQRTLAIAALVAIVVGNLLCLKCSTFLEFATARTLAGIGCGLTLAAFGMLAATDSPQRNFAIYNGLIIATIAIAAACAPALFELGGGSALFVLIAAGGALALALVGWLPNARPSNEARSSWRIALAPERRYAAASSLAMMLLLFIPVGAFWSYTAEIGAAHNYAAGFVANAISLSFFAGGIVASATAALLGHSRDHRRILRLCIIGLAFAAAVASLAVTPIVYFVAMLVFVFLWMLAWPYAMSLLTRIDATGWLAVAGLLIQSAGFSIGPAFTGSLISARQLGAFAGACSLLLLLSLVALAIQPKDSE